MSIRDSLAFLSAPAWVTNTKGDILSGKVVARTTRTGTEYADYEVITVQPDEAPTVDGSTKFTIKVGGEEIDYDGRPLAWHAMGTTAAARVKDSNPLVGDDIAVLMDGQRVGLSGAGKGKSYNVWQVAVDKSANPPAQLQTEQLPVEQDPGVQDAAANTAAGYAPANVSYADEEPF